MDGPFHAGEIEVQRRAGSLDMARAVGGGIGDEVSAAASHFLSRQRLAVAATRSADGQVWASLLSGPAGFIEIVDPRLLRLAVAPRVDDPLADNLAARPELGLLVLEPATRRRFRLNGRGLLRREGVFLAVEQAYGNCPKYIQRREPLPDGGASSRSASVSPGLDAGQQARIAGTDTFFIASGHPQGGADASHRGGLPGFVRVLGPRRLEFDHYPGNGMFNTLGNLAVTPRAGLLFVDFENGDVLQATGEAAVAGDFRVTFDVHEVRDTPGASRLRYALTERSPANPPLSPAAPAGISTRAGSTREEKRS